MNCCRGHHKKDEDKRDLLLSADDERRLRDGTERESRELDEAVREAVARVVVVPASRYVNRCSVLNVSGW